MERWLPNMQSHSYAYTHKGHGAEALLFAWLLLIYWHLVPPDETDKEQRSLESLTRSCFFWRRCNIHPLTMHNHFDDLGKFKLEGRENESVRKKVMQKHTWLQVNRWVDVSSLLVFYLKESEWHQWTCIPKKQNKTKNTEID